MKKQLLEQSKRAFFGVGNEKYEKPKPPQSEMEAMDVFYGIQDQKKKGEMFGNPIPGYSGVNRRIQADNVFGMTYAESRRRAMESQMRIDLDKGETLKTTQKFIPEHQRARESEFYF
mmetsp:Transcript_14317/g.10357  ORF Transcript_14317/g.10357 Transcript_14317/m.10357 type:complete len:117 (-) Transcript_14317:25-375(-)